VMRMLWLSALMLGLVVVGAGGQTKKPAGFSARSVSQAPKAGSSATKKAGPRAGRPSPSADEVVAIINGEKITREQIAEDVLADQQARLKATNPQFQDRVRPIAGSIGVLVLNRLAASGGKPVTISRQDIVRWLLEEKSPVVREAVQNRIREVAIAQYAKKMGVTLTDADIAKQVSKAIENARTQLRMQGKTDAQVLAELGYRSAMLRRGVITSMYLEAIAKKELEEKIGHPLGPDDFREGRHILVRVNLQPPAGQSGAGQQQPKDAEAAYAEAKAKIDTIAKEIENKTKTFEKAAMDSSDDPSKFQEGKLGVFVRGQMVPEFEAVAFSLPVGVVSQPVRTQFGWHLIRIDRLGSSLTEAEREQAWQNYMRSRAQSLINKILSEANIVNKIGPPQPMNFPGMGPQ